MDDRQSQPYLVCRAGERTCALPIDAVVETLRPLPIAAVGGAPAGVLGLSVVRGAPVPVIDLALLLGLGADTSHPITRFVIVNSAGRRVALSVAAVLGVQQMAHNTLTDLPPLVKDQHSARAEPGEALDPVTALGMRDAELLMVLQASKLLPEEALSFVMGQAA